jgi:hypothetical protein
LGEDMVLGMLADREGVDEKLVTQSAAAFSGILKLASIAARISVVVRRFT